MKHVYARRSQHIYVTRRIGFGKPSLKFQIEIGVLYTHAY